MTDPRLAELDALPTDQLRERAFAIARERRDFGFFWDVFEHLPHADDAEQLDGSTGSYGNSIEDAIGLWREFIGREGYGSTEPLLRARFIDYILANS